VKIVRREDIRGTHRDVQSPAGWTSYRFLLKSDGMGYSLHELAPGTVYALDHHDRHVVKSHTELRMICVFNPPVTGRELHDEDGSYALPAEDG